MTTENLLDPEPPPGDSTDTGMIVIQVEAKCTDRRFGSLLGRYVADALASSERSIFEEHMEHCIACDTAVFNWLELKRAAQRLFRP